MFMNTLGYSSDKFISVALSGSVAESTVGKHDHSYHSITYEQDKKMEEHISILSNLGFPTTDGSMPRIENMLTPLLQSPICMTATKRCVRKKVSFL